MGLGLRVALRFLHSALFRDEAVLYYLVNVFAFAQSGFVVQVEQPKLVA